MGTLLLRGRTLLQVLLTEALIKLTFWSISVISVSGLIKSEQFSRLHSVNVRLLEQLLE